MTANVEDLLRESALTYGHVQLFRDKHGWQASICHYGTPPMEPVQQTDSKIFADPVEALRKVLMEDDRKTRDIQRSYANAPKAGAQIDLEEAIADAVVRDEFEDLIG
jgi:hypothetical protein